jgi:hypothetical protein
MEAKWTVKKRKFIGFKQNGCLSFTDPQYADWETICKDDPNLYPNASRDWIAAQLYTNTAAGTRGAGFIGLSENAGGAGAGHTSLAGEITTNGLARADATDKTHTAGTNVTTIHHLFTCNTAPFSAVQLLGLFNAAGPPVNGTMVNEKAITSTQLNVNDQIDVTVTITGPSTGT